MAKQMGIFPIQGTLGNVTFFKTVDGFTVRRKGGVTAGRIASDPKFIRTRENIREFSTSATAARLVKKAFMPLLKGVADSRMFSRLAAITRTAINADLVSDRGQRNMVNGNPLLLEGFEFCRTGHLAATLSAPYTVTVDRAGGRAQVSLDSFVPELDMSSPQGATHFALVSGASVLDFAGSAAEGGTTAGSILTLDTRPTGILSLDSAFAAGATQPVAVVLGVVFYQKMNGSYYPLSNTGYNALAIVKIDV